MSLAGVCFANHQPPTTVTLTQFRTLVDQAQQRVRLSWVVADAGYDSESNHRFAREEHGIRTIIPAKHGRPTDKPARGHDRRLMQIRFDTVVYGQRAQIETVMSMLKRRQSTFVRGRNYQRQCRDLRLMALTHNILILYRCVEFSTEPLAPGTVRSNRMLGGAWRRLVCRSLA